MARSLRSKVARAHRNTLRAKVFAPAERARDARLSARLRAAAGINPVSLSCSERKDLIEQNSPLPNITPFTFRYIMDDEDDLADMEIDNENTSDTTPAAHHVDSLAGELQNQQYVKMDIDKPSIEETCDVNSTNLFNDSDNDVAGILTSSLHPEFSKPHSARKRRSRCSRIKPGTRRSLLFYPTGTSSKACRQKRQWGKSRVKDRIGRV